jgi:hypothetical protein
MVNLCIEQRTVRYQFSAGNISNWHVWDEPRNFLTGGLQTDSSDVRPRSGSGYSFLKSKSLSTKVDVSGLTGDQWLIWSGGNLNIAQNELADPFERGVRMEMDLSQKKKRVNSTTTPRKKQREDTVTSVYMTMHMPPKNPGDRVQPYATADDGHLLMAPGNTYEVKAKITYFKKLNTNSQPCTEETSLFSWQVRFIANGVELPQQFMLRIYKRAEEITSRYIYFLNIVL